MEQMSGEGAGTEGAGGGRNMNAGKCTHSRGEEKRKGKKSPPPPKEKKKGNKVYNPHTS